MSLFAIVCIGIAWLSVACTVAPITGRGIRLADQHEQARR